MSIFPLVLNSWYTFKAFWGGFNNILEIRSVTSPLIKKTISTNSTRNSHQMTYGYLFDDLLHQDPLRPSCCIQTVQFSSKDPFQLTETKLLSLCKRGCHQKVLQPTRPKFSVSWILKRRFSSKGSRQKVLQPTKPSFFSSWVLNL